MSDNLRTKMPPGPRGLPRLDDLRELQQSPLAAVLKALRQYGDLVHYPLGPLAVYLANHPDHARHVLQDNSKNYSKDTFQYNLLQSVTGHGLLTSDGAFWLRQRRLAQPAFHRERVAALIDLMAGATDEMLVRWEPAARTGRPLDVAEEMMRLTLDIVSKALFSIDMSHEAAGLAEAVLTVLDHVVYRARSLGMIPAGLPTQRNRRFSAALAALDDAVYRLIAERRRNGTAAPNDLLSMLMAAQNQDQGASTAGGPDQMTDRQLRDEVMTLLIAGHETVASALTWTWYLLSQDRDVEAKVRAEAERSDPRALARATAPTYTRMVLDEALRLYPPAWLITRRALAGDEIGGYRIPPGALVVLSPYAMHRHPAFWEDPERFDPQRFSAEHSADRPRFAYIPFGGGPRLCIGNVFALVEAQVVLASVARAYRLELVAGQTIVPEPSVTLRPKHGLLICIRGRSSSWVRGQAHAAREL